MHPSIPQSALHSHSYSERAESPRFSVFDLLKRPVEDGEEEERNSLWWVMMHLPVSVGGWVGPACGTLPAGVDPGHHTAVGTTHAPRAVWHS